MSDAGHDAVHVGDLALLGATEETVMAAALDDSRIVVSADTDFGEVLAASIAQYPSVILLRRKGRTAEQQASILLANFAAVENDLAVGAMVVVLQDPPASEAAPDPPPRMIAGCCAGRLQATAVGLGANERKGANTFETCPNG